MNTPYQGGDNAQKVDLQKLHIGGVLVPNHSARETPKIQKLYSSLPPAVRGILEGTANFFR